MNLIVTVNKLSKGKDLLDLISQTDCHANTDFIFSSFFLENVELLEIIKNTNYF